MHRTFIVMSPRWKGWPVRAFAVMRPLLWVCREQLAQGGKRTQRNEFETHQVFAAKRQRLQHLLSDRGIGDIEDEDDTRTALKRVPLVDLALEVEFRRGLHLAGQDAADLLKVRARLDCSDRQNPRGRSRGRCRLSHGPQRSGARAA